MNDGAWIDILDVSEAQGMPDWARVAEAEVAPGVDRRWRGAYIKVAEGEAYKDPKRVANIAALLAAGLPWGAYLYVHPMKDAEKQIRNAYEAIGDTMPSFPLMLDVEAADPSLTPQQIVDAIRRARDAALQWFGRMPSLYTFPDYWLRRVLRAALQAPDLAEIWLHWAYYGTGLPWYPSRSHLPMVPDPWRTAGKLIAMWQYSGNTRKVPGAWDGRVAGIAGDVDRNVFTLGEDAFLYDFCGQPRPEQLEPEAPIVRPLT